MKVIDLAGLRRMAGLTQVDLAALLGVGQAQISKIERQHDMLLSTLSAYLTALGATATAVVEIDQQTMTYTLATRQGDR